MLPSVSIIVPHFQTAELVKLCLRSIRKHTHNINYEVIVVDNASNDKASLEYLRQVDWIHLIERPSVHPVGSIAHCEAVQVGFDAARAPFILTIHTDTIPLQDDWIQYHFAPMIQDHRVAAVGTDKLILRSSLQEWFRRIEDALMWWKRSRAIRKHSKRSFIRSHCALYRHSALQQHGLRYDSFMSQVAGLGLHNELTRLGHDCCVLNARQVIHRVAHLNHATELLIPELRSQCRTIHWVRGRHRIARFFQRADVQEILHDDSLDHGSLEYSEQGDIQDVCLRTPNAQSLHQVA